MDEPPDREVLLFNAALELAGERRTAYLIEACGGDHELRRRVEGLLRSHTKAGDFLERPAESGDPFRSGPASAMPPLAAVLDSASMEKPGDRIGRYRLLQQIGEGGCGVVYMAEQQAPVRRRVALKIIKLGMDTRSVIARFEAEQQALALMDHPNIARVLDAGATETGRPFFVMELVRGVRITEYSDQNGLGTRERLDLFIQVCHAVQHAHQKGVIHRDLKPSNILVTVNDGVAVPKVIDFGIAKATQGRLTDQTLFTAFEQFIGTPAYMSPEQAVFTSVDIDTRSDIYSLGVLLYELLTGRTPFNQNELLAAGIEEMRRTLRDREPSPPSTCLSGMVPDDLDRVAGHRRSEPPQLIHQIRGDLDWIVMKCLEKDRARRYQTAIDIAADLERHLANEPIVARPPGRFYRLQKLVRRNRLAVASGAAVVAALVAGLGLTTWQYLEKSRAEHEQSELRAEAQQAQANEAQLRRVAQQHEQTARRKAYASDMKLLQQALATDDLGRAQDLLNRQRPDAGQADLRGWEWRYLWQFCQGDSAFTLCQRSNSVVSVSFSNDGSLLAVGTFSGEVTVWEIASRQMIFHHAGTGQGPARVAFSPVDPILAIGLASEGPDAVSLWNRGGATPLHRLPINGPVRDLVFSAEGRLFTAQQGGTNTITLWDVQGRMALDRFEAAVGGAGMGHVFAVVGTADRFAHVLAGSTHSIRMVDLAGGSERRIRVSDELTTALAFSDDGGILATGGGYADGRINLWNLGTGQLAGTLEGHRSWISRLKLLADGRTLASASADRTIRLWDLETRRLMKTLRGHGGELWTIDISRDGRWLASGGKDGSVVFWNLDSSMERPKPFRTLDREVDWWTYAPDGRSFGVLRKGRLELYDAASLEGLGEPDLALTNVVRFTFSPDNRHLFVTDEGGRLGVWDLAAQRMTTNFQAHPVPAHIFASGLLSGGASLLTCDWEGTAKEWDVSSWNELRRWKIRPGMNTGAINARGDLVVTTSRGGAVELIDPAHPENRREFFGATRSECVKLSPDGKVLAMASENGVLDLWDTAALSRLAALRGVLLGFHSVAFSSDGERVAAGSNGQEAVTLWDVESYEEVAKLPGQGSFFSDLEFSPDGRSIAARNWGGLLHIWTAPSWEEIETAEQTRRASSF